MKRLAGCVVIFLLLSVACKRKFTRVELEDELKTAMSNSLNGRVNFDTTIAKFDVLKVTFYEGKTNFDCEFIVRERKPGGYDTTGAMAAIISKDFKSVNRKY